MSAEDVAASDTNLKTEEVQDQNPGHEDEKPEAKTETKEPLATGDVQVPQDDAEKSKEEEKPAKEEKKDKKGGKVEIRLQATGDAPIMKQRNYSVESSKKIGEICGFVRKYLKLDEKENLFLYVNQAFAPSPDQTILNLKECFGSDGKLVLYYSRNQAWG